MELNISIQPTPNPNALKFILDKTVKSEGKVSFKTPSDCKDIPLAEALFDLRGVDQLHFFQNVVTVSKFTFEPWESLEPTVVNTLENMFEQHNPDFTVVDPVAERRKKLPPELLAIEEILDKRIRPGLQGDGGDLECVSFEAPVLMIKYEGACGTCPSSTTGTLQAIRAILQDEYDPEIEVYTLAPDGPAAMY